MRILIVGAGPAGASLAYLLARRGIEVTLLERHTDFEREFRGEALMPSGVDALTQMGLSAQVDALPQTRPTTLELYRGERRIIRISLEGRSTPEAADVSIVGPRIVSQPAMLEMLVAEAARFPSFHLERGVTVRDLLHEGDRVVGVRADMHAGERELRADLVVGADGRGSVLRRRARLTEQRMPQAFDIVWCKVPLPRFLAEPPTVRAYLGRGHAALLFPSYGERLQIGWIIDKGSFGELRARGVDAWLEEMSAHVSSDLREHLVRSRGDLTHPFLLDVVSDRLPRWTLPGLLLIGDAAHAMSPVGAQGINVALRDAIVAANELVPVLRTEGPPDAVDAATQRVQAQRFPEIETIQTLQQAPPPLLFGRGLWRRLLIDYGLPFFVRTGIAQRFALPTLRRLTTGVSDVVLRE